MTGGEDKMEEQNTFVEIATSSATGGLLAMTVVGHIAALSFQRRRESRIPRQQIHLPG